LCGKENAISLGRGEDLREQSYLGFPKRKPLCEEAPNSKPWKKETRTQFLLKREEPKLKPGTSKLPGLGGRTGRATYRPGQVVHWPVPPKMFPGETNTKEEGKNRSLGGSVLIEVWKPKRISRTDLQKRFPRKKNLWENFCPL